MKGSYTINNNEPKHKEGEPCSCMRCQLGEEAYNEWVNKALGEYGWIMHYVPEDPATPFTNIHTHGFPEKFNHKDIQITYNLPMKLAGSLMHEIAGNLANGTVYEPGKKYDNVLRGYDVTFAEAEECGRPVLRMILPDKDGKFNSSHPYVHQWEGTTTTPID